MGVGTAGIVTSPVDRKTPLPPHLTIMTNPNGASSPGAASSPVMANASPNLGSGSGMKRTDSMRGGPRDGGGAAEDMVSKVDGGLTLAAAERMLRWHAEAVGRVVQLSQSDV
jgi:hypothetical protein